VICLAMHYGLNTDVERMHEIARIYDASIIAVSVSNEPAPANKVHVSADFKTVRGLKTLIHTIHRLTDERIIIILDYIWLQSNYYLEKYGVNWLTEKCTLLLEAGATQIILPFDNGIRTITSAMKAMLTSVDPRLNIQFLPTDSNPLYVATDSVRIKQLLEDSGKLGNEANAIAYLDSRTPFVSITLRVKE
jgi:hypothetical protein